jgi:hypothetical protein
VRVACHALVSPRTGEGGGGGGQKIRYCVRGGGEKCSLGSEKDVTPRSLNSWRAF